MPGDDFRHKSGALKDVATAEFMKLLNGSEEYSQFLVRFPPAEGLTVTLPELDSE